MKAIIVDDELRAQSTLKGLLEVYCPQIEVVSVASRISEAVTEINLHQPDWVFLDIEMPGENGFALFKWIPNPSFKTIFTTAYQQYAIDAFKVSAVDYLLKPIQAEHLVQSIQRISAIQQSEQNQRINYLNENLKHTEINRVSFPTSNGLRFIDPNEIILLKSDGSYTHVWLSSNEKLLISRKLGELEFTEILPYFIRTHRSFVVNLNRVKEFVRSDGGYLIMENGETASISREKKENIINRLS